METDHSLSLDIYPTSQETEAHVKDQYSDKQIYLEILNYLKRCVLFSKKYLSINISAMETQTLSSLEKSAASFQEEISNFTKENNKKFLVKSNQIKADQNSHKTIHESLKLSYFLVQTNKITLFSQRIEQLRLCIIDIIIERKSYSEPDSESSEEDDEFDSFVLGKDKQSKLLEKEEKREILEWHGVTSKIGHLLVVASEKISEQTEIVGNIQHSCEMRISDMKNANKNLEDTNEELDKKELYFGVLVYILALILLIRLLCK